MSYYLDTSALIALYCPEPWSGKTERILQNLEHLPVISELVEVEFCSALARKKQLQEISNKSAKAVLSEFFSHLDQRYYRRCLLNSRHFQQARDWLFQLKISLRTLDALHLAICHQEKLPFLTADKRLVRAARFFGIETVAVL